MIKTYSHWCCLDKLQVTKVIMSKVRIEIERRSEGNIKTIVLKISFKIGFCVFHLHAPSCLNFLICKKEAAQ